MASANPYMASSSPTETSVPTKREVVLLCAVTIIHAVILSQAVHIPFTLSRGNPKAPNTLSVELLAHSTPSLRNPISPEIDKRITDKTESPSFAKNRNPLSASALPPRIAASGAEQSELSKQYPRYSPPSAILQYSARALSKGSEVSGQARIFWQSNERFYSIQGDVALEDKNALSFTSEGVIDNRLGVSPNIYLERRLDEAPTNARFHWDSNDISFSTTSKRQTLRGGEQDRASVIWQLVRMGRQGNKLIALDARFNLTVVDYRDTSLWQIHVVEQSDLITKLGGINTWHLVLTPKNKSDLPEIEVWLAPKHEWYPVKIRYTHTNSEVLDLSIQEITLTPDT